MEGSGHGLICSRTEERHRHSGHPVSRPEFEPTTSRIQRNSANSVLTFSIKNVVKKI
jgi:hypothetical protein